MCLWQLSATWCSSRAGSSNSGQTTVQGLHPDIRVHGGRSGPDWPPPEARPTRYFLHSGGSAISLTKQSTGGPSYADEVEGERKRTFGGVVVRSTRTRRFVCAVGPRRGVFVHDGRSQTRPQMCSVRAALPRYQQEGDAPLVHHAAMRKSLESCSVCSSPTQPQLEGSVYAAHLVGSFRRGSIPLSCSMNQDD